MKPFRVLVLVFLALYSWRLALIVATIGVAVWLWEDRHVAREPELDNVEGPPSWLPSPLGLVTLDPNEAILVTPRGVELDLRDSDLELDDVLEHVRTVEAL